MGEAVTRADKKLILRQHRPAADMAYGLSREQAAAAPN